MRIQIERLCWVFAVVQVLKNRHYIGIKYAGILLGDTPMRGNGREAKRAFRPQLNLIPAELVRKERLGGRICLGHEIKTETVLGTQGKLVMLGRGVLDWHTVLARLSERLWAKLAFQRYPVSSKKGLPWYHPVVLSHGQGVAPRSLALVQMR